MKYLTFFFAMMFSTGLFADMLCERYFLSSAQEELALQKKIEWYQKKTDSLRRFMGDEHTQSQVHARSRTRIFNFFLQNTNDHALIYNAFMPIFRDVQESYLIILNYAKRKKDLEIILKSIRPGEELSKESLDYLDSIGHSFNAGTDPIKHIRNILADYDQELLKREVILVSSVDEFTSLELSLSELVKSSSISDAQRQQFERLMETLRVKSQNIETRPYQFKEQIEGNSIPLINTKTIKEFIDKDMRLKKDLWRVRYQEQLNGLFVYGLFKVRLHERLLSYINKKIPVKFVVTDKIKQLMAMMSKKLVNHQMINEYSARIALQVEPAMKARPIAEQFENLVNSNSLSERSDEYLIALNRSIDGKKSWDELIAFAKENPSHADMYARMIKAEKEARILGDLKIPEKQAGPGRIALLTATQITLAWFTLEYAGVVNFFPDTDLDDELRPILDVLKNPHKSPERTKVVIDSLEKKVKDLPGE